MLCRRIIDCGHLPINWTNDNVPVVIEPGEFEEMAGNSSNEIKQVGYL